MDEQSPIIWDQKTENHEVMLYVDERGRTRLLIDENAGEYVEFWNVEDVEQMVQALATAALTWRKYEDRAENEG